MKKFMVITLMGIVGYLSVLPENEAQAANKDVNEDECAIWICLPAGFGEGCSAAHREFKKRLKKFKPPLPSWNSCAVDGGVEPYSYKKHYKTYTNYGRNNIKEKNGRNCPNNGEIYWNNRRSNGIEAICTTTDIYTTTFYDGSGQYIHEEERWGKPLSQTLNKDFNADKYRPDKESGSER